MGEIPIEILLTIPTSSTLTIQKTSSGLVADEQPEWSGF